MINFTKMHGLGNDFMVIDGVNQSVTLNKQKIHTLAERHTGVGFDQLLLIETNESAEYDFTYRIFNADGNEVEQCGNGARCAARFVQAQQLSDKQHLRFKTKNGSIETYLLTGNQVKVNMGVPRLQPRAIPIQARQYNDYYRIDGWRFGAVSLGNPHAVICVNDIAKAPVTTVGKQLAKHAYFPEQANIGFMQVLDRETISLRVWERGVGETQACGSGACAAVVIGKLQGLLDAPVQVKLSGGQLAIDWQGQDEPVWMTGSAEFVFTGRITNNGQP